MRKRRRIRTMDSSSSDSETEDSRRSREKKFKEIRDKRVKDIKESCKIQLEEVIWTPSMYQKWDKFTSNKSKPSFSRSFSSEDKKHSKNKSVEKVQRSVSVVESSKFKTSSPSKSTLPKIPKLKKAE